MLLMHHPQRVTFFTAIQRPLLWDKMIRKHRFMTRWSSLSYDSLLNNAACDGGMIVFLWEKICVAVDFD